jgi:hypothetical protein
LDLFDSKYIFLVEHDWKFLRQINVRKLVCVFNQFDNVNQVQFHKRKNSPGGVFNHVEPTAKCGWKLCKVSAYANAPNISRKKKLKQWARKSVPNIRLWLQILKYRGPYIGKSLRDVLIEIWLKHIDRRKGSIIHEIEHWYNTKYQIDILEYGFRQAHDDRGIYFYDDFNEGPYIEHLGR